MDNIRRSTRRVFRSFPPGSDHDVGSHPLPEHQKPSAVIPHISLPEPGLRYCAERVRAVGLNIHLAQSLDRHAQGDEAGAISPCQEGMEGSREEA